MWESSAPVNNENSNQMFVTTNRFNGQLMNSSRNTSSEQAFQTCRSIINRFDHQPSDDSQVFSDEDDDDDEGGMTPRGSKKKGPHSFVFQLNVQNIHLAANAPMVIIYESFFLSIFTGNRNFAVRTLAEGF
jgi:hypothetical protein